MKYDVNIILLICIVVQSGLALWQTYTVVKRNRYIKFLKSSNKNLTGIVDQEISLCVYLIERLKTTNISQQEKEGLHSSHLKLLRAKEMYFDVWKEEDL